MHLPKEMTGSGALFAVKVAGDSMANANIFDGDCVIVRQQDTAHNGDIVAALIEDEATVTTFHHADGHVWLMPQNPGYQPIPGDQCGLIGKIVATLHRICTGAIGSLGQNLHRSPEPTQSCGMTSGGLLGVKEWQEGQ